MTKADGLDGTIIRNGHVQAQYKLCPFCKRGLHDKCIAKRAEHLCCCSGEPSTQLEAGTLSANRRRMNQPRHNFNDFLRQIESVKAKGSLKLLRSNPNVSKILSPGEVEYIDSKIDIWQAIILAMTEKERQVPDILTPERIRRIAKGSGSRVKDVIELLDRLNAGREIPASKGSPLYHR